MLEAIQHHLAFGRRGGCSVEQPHRRHVDGDAALVQALAFANAIDIVA